MSDKIASNKDQERKWLIMANLYTLEDLLIGKTYRSRSRLFEGEIISAEKRSDVWYGENTQAYLIGVDTPMSFYTKYATIAVKVGE